MFWKGLLTNSFAHSNWTNSNDCRCLSLNEISISTTNVNEKEFHSEFGQYFSRIPITLYFGNFKIIPWRTENKNIRREREREIGRIIEGNKINRERMASRILQIQVLKAIRGSTKRNEASFVGLKSKRLLDGYPPLRDLQSRSSKRGKLKIRSLNEISYSV